MRIEEHADQALDVVIVAVSGRKASRAVVKDLERYDIRTAVMILPWLFDAFPQHDILNNRVHIKDLDFIADDAEIFSDETSEIIIEAGATIYPHVVILAEGSSCIRIGADAEIQGGAFILADGRSRIDLGCNVQLENHVSMHAETGGIIRFEKDVQVSARTNLASSNRGMLLLGEGTSINVGGYLSAARGSELRLGKYNMLSLFVKMQTGVHDIVDRETGAVRTNRSSICTGNHVWIGMGATFVAGANVGEDSVVGASAVVTKKFPPHCTIAGNPAHILHEGISWIR